ncbi:MAG: DUF523 domain-containing protein [Nitrospirae bacterium]|nr:DUF523 domain-containing protein [Nitrospirota bacterium]
MIIVSACLAGIRCRYDEKDVVAKEVRSLVREGKALPVCPEQLGGLPTPRSPAEIVDGDGEDVLRERARVIDKEKRDVTEQFIKGARQVADLAKLVGARQAIFKSGSPSCGCGRIKGKGVPVKGNGVAAALLLREGIEVSEK